MNSLSNHADVEFLRRILFALIVSTIAVGGVATYIVVKAGQVSFVPAIFT